MCDEEGTTKERKRVKLCKRRESEDSQTHIFLTEKRGSGVPTFQRWLLAESRRLNLIQFKWALKFLKVKL